MALPKSPKKEINQTEVITIEREKKIHKVDRFEQTTVLQMNSQKQTPRSSRSNLSSSPSIKSTADQFKSQAEEVERKMRQMAKKNDLIERLLELKAELKKVLSETKGQQCMESLNRRLQISLRESNEVETKKTIESLKVIVHQLCLDQNLIQKLKNLSLSGTNKDTRVSNAAQFVRSMEVLNLIEIQFGIQEINKQKKENLNMAMIFLGNTGAGKTATFTGFAGHKIKAIKIDENMFIYEAEDSEVARKNKISARMISCTKSPSVALINQQWLPDRFQGYLVVDTGGFQDTRSPQIDIINNISTENIVKKIKQGKFILFISKSVASDDRGIALAKFGEQIERYIPDLDDLSQSIFFVFTKGLTTKDLLKRLDDMMSAESYKAPKFCKILKRFLETNIYLHEKPWEIHNPAEHDFGRLVDCITKRTLNISQPSSFMKASFSRDSIAQIQNKKMIVEKILKIYYQKGDSNLTIFYLQQLRKIEEQIQSSSPQTFKSCLLFIKKFEERKAKECEQALQIFLRKNIPQHLQDFRQKNTKLKNSNEIAKFVFDSEQIPEIQIKKLVEYHLDLAEKCFIDESQSFSDTSIRAHLNLIKQYREQNYKSIVESQESKKRQMENSLLELIKGHELNEQTWDDAVKRYIGLFLISSPMSRQERYERINELIKKAFQSLNYEGQIKQILSNGRKKVFQNSLYNVIKLYLKKLSTLGRTHYLVRQQTNFLKENCSRTLSDESSFYVKILEKILEINNEEIVNIQVYLKNSAEVFKVLDNFNITQMNDHRKNISMNEMVDFIVNNIDLNTSEFVQKIRDILTDSSKVIESKKIEANFKTLNKLLKILERIDANQDDKEEDEKIPNLQEKITQSKNSIANIVKMMENTCQSLEVKSYTVNHQLLSVLVILMAIKDEFDDNSVTQKCQKICEDLKMKMLKPLKKLKDSKFENYYEFQKLIKLMTYLRNLNKKCEEHRLNSDSFQQFIYYQKDETLENILDSCFDCIKVLNEKFESFNQNELETESIQVGKELKFQKFSVAEAVHYIKCYDVTKNICEEFQNDDIEKISDQLSNIDEKNLELKIKSRLKFYKESLEVNTKSLTQGDMTELRRSVTLLMMILERAKKTESFNEFVNFREDINRRIVQLGQTWQMRYDDMRKRYQRIEVGEQFGELMELANDPGSEVAENKTLIKTLFNSIDVQIARQLQNLFIKFDEHEPNIRVKAFESIYKFKDQCDKMKIEYNFEIEMLKNNCDYLFRGFENSLEFHIKNIKEGLPIANQERTLKELESQENRFKIYLKDEYNNFLKKKNIETTLYQNFIKNKEETMVKVNADFLNETFRISENFMSYYTNASNQNKQKLKHNYERSTREQIEQFEKIAEIDHEKFEEKSRELKEYFDLSPQAISKGFIQKMHQIKEAKQVRDEEFKKNLENSLNERNGIEIIRLLSTAVKLNNKNQQDRAKNQFESFVDEESKLIRFTKGKNLSAQIVSMNQLPNNSIFKQMVGVFPDLKKTVESFEMKYKQRAQRQISKAEQGFQKECKNFLESIERVDENYECIEDLKIPDSVTIQKLQILITSNKKSEKFTEETALAYKAIGKLNEIVNKKIEQSTLFFEKLLSHLASDTKFEQSCNQIYNSIRQGQYFKQQSSILVMYNKLDEMKSKLDERVTMGYDNVIRGIKDKCLQIFSEAKNWKPKSVFLRDTEDRIRQRIQKRCSQIEKVEKYSRLFLKEHMIPHDVVPFLQQIYGNLFKQWEKDVKIIISNIFTNTSNNQTEFQEVQKFYKANKMLEKRMKIFSDKMEFTNQVSDLLIRLFKENETKLENFYKIDKNLENYQKMKLSVIKIKDELKSKVELLQIEEQEEYREMEDKEALALRGKTEQVEKGSQEEREIKKQGAGKVESKRNDIKQKFIKDKQQSKEQSAKEVKKIEEEIVSFFQENFLSFLIVKRIAKSNFRCEDFINSYYRTIEDHLKVAQIKFGKSINRICYNILSQAKNNYAQLIVLEEKDLNAYKNLKFGESTNGKDYKTLLGLIPAIAKDQSKFNLMMDRYQKYCAEYEKLLSKFKDSADFQVTEMQVAMECKNLGAYVAQSYINGKLGEQKVSLLANIFALLAIKKSIIDEENVVDFVFKPHPGQLLSIFLLLELQNPLSKKEIAKAMIQVSTGEGKSIILGALCAFLALAEFEVYEACYSSYLSGRDYSQFSELFVSLGIDKSIHYDIFPQICKMMLNPNPSQPFVKKVQDYLLEKSEWNNFGGYFESVRNPNNKKKRILVIDEADVFINEQFLGEIYYPSIQIKNDSIKALLDYVWSFREKKSELSPEIIINSPEFKKVCENLGHPIFTEIMQNQTHDMVRGLFSFDEDKKFRVVINNKIFYHEGDGLSEKVHYGYRTIFAYYAEHYIRENVDYKHFTNQIFVNLIIASFSYSKLPQLFDSILGVTGTLDAMSDGQLDILENDYGVKKRYILKSIYPEDTRSIDFEKVYTADLYKAITENASKQFERDRPIVIFFKTKSELYNFFDSAEYINLRRQSAVVSYEVSSEERDFRIENSTMGGKITLMTIDFSRGTDMKLLPSGKEKEECKGLHLISTFMPSSYCDYVQLVGRVGRQGKKGTAVIFLAQEEPISKENGKIDKKSAEQLIRQSDNKQWFQKLGSIKEKIRQSISVHEKSDEIFSPNSNVDSLLKSIQQMNKTEPLRKNKTKTSIMIDATASMMLTLAQISKVLKSAIPRIRQILQTAGSQANFELQLCIYRNYNSSVSQIFKYSNFETNTQYLIDWITPIRASEGWGNEAIEVGFQHINNLQEIDQVIIIGDAKANTAKETKSKRKNFQSVWDNDSTYPFTTYEQEVKKLIERKTKVHSFYLNPPKTKQFFQDLSKRTGGVAQEFGIRSDDRTDKFTNFIAERVLESISEKTGGKDLVSTYRDAHRKTYCN